MNYFRYFAYFFHICSALHTFKRQVGILTGLSRVFYNARGFSYTVPTPVLSL